MEQLIDIQYYETDTGKCPYTEWEQNLSKEVRATIRKRLNHIRLGHFGDSKHLDGDLHELRVNFGPGFRIYYCKKGRKVVILLCGGDKGSQSRDIARALKYMQDLA